MKRNEDLQKNEVGTVVEKRGLQQERNDR